MEALDPVGLDDVALGDIFAQLDEEERNLSRRRTTLHTRIDFVASGGYANPDGAAEHLAELRDEERRLSDDRRALHQRLTEIRAELRRRRDGAHVDNVR